jgi:hypothetical protein
MAVEPLFASTVEAIETLDLPGGEQEAIDSDYERTERSERFVVMWSKDGWGIRFTWSHDLTVTIGLIL